MAATLAMPSGAFAQDADAAAVKRRLDQLTQKYLDMRGADFLAALQAGKVRDDGRPGLDRCLSVAALLR